MLSRSVVRKLLHQHFFTFLHSRRAVLLTVFALSLLLFSLLQFGDTVLEWSLNQVQVIQHAQQTTNNILGKSFQNKLCYNEPIDVVYTWVNGSDSWHQKQLAEYRSQQLGQNHSDLSEKSLSSDQKLALLCAFSICIQAKAVLISPPKSQADLREVFEISEKKSETLKTYLFHNKTLALAPDAFHLDDLLEEKDLNVNGVNYHFVAVHLLLQQQNNPEIPPENSCFPTDLIAIIQDARRAEKVHVEEKFQGKIDRVDIYDSLGLLVVYSKEKLIGEKFHVGNREFILENVCVMENVQMDHKENELQLSRFKDNEELRFSIRALVKHAGWVRQIFLVTNGQIPYWLNLDHPKIRIVTHQEIFVNQSDLPTFSSSAIESHLHRIPGLSKKFIYFNDDVLLGQDVLPEDFFSQSEGYKIHLSWHVPACSEGCPSGWIADGFCDATCNNWQCNFDGGDCVNKSRVDRFDLDGDDDDDDRFAFTGTCHAGCLNAWLADRYCDTVCNHRSCGFDIGDCGLDKLVEFPRITLQENLQNYQISNGEFVALFDTSQLVDANWTLKDGHFDSVKGVRAVSVLPGQKAVVILLHPNSTGRINLTLNFVSNTSDLERRFLFVAAFDSAVVSDLVVGGKATVTFASVPEELRSPKPRFRPSNLGLSTLSPGDAARTLAELQAELENGDLTAYGFQLRKAQLLGSPFDYTQFTTAAPEISTKIPTAKKVDFTTKKTTTTAGIENWNKKTTTISSAKNTLKTMDAFADSLKYVNRLYNEAFGIEARKVPAHIPHFVEREVMEQLQVKFAEEFAKTSATKVRSSHDMQFAFLYFYYVMSLNATVSLADIFHEIDVDNSGLWSEREIRLAALRQADTAVDEAGIRRFYADLANCTTKTEMDLRDVLGCPSVVHSLLKSTARRKQFKFRVADSEGFTFVRTSNNASKVQKELDAILRYPKKFICINDEVDYTREDADQVLKIIREFFLTLFPRASPFELPNGQRNVFLHVEELRKWNFRRRCIAATFWILSMLLLAVGVCFCFPKFRWKFTRLFHIFQRNRSPVRSRRVLRVKSPV